MAPMPPATTVAAATASAPTPAPTDSTAPADSASSATAQQDPPATSATTSSSSTSQSLDEAMRAAAGVSPSATSTGDTSSNNDQTNLPMKPSQGAVQQAVAGVVSAAGTCLGPDDPVANATIIFNSSGAVSRVIVNNAAGKEACIRGMLMRAHVSPFTQSSFTWAVIIRPS
jgi:hypothetical protein